jgi:hypothetical protein
MSFLGGLIQGYADQKLKAADMEHQQERETKQNRISYLKAAIGSGNLTPDAMNAALDELGEITGGGKKGGKGKEGGPIEILKKLAGHVSKQQAPTPFEQRVPGQGGSRPETLGDIPQPQQRATAAVAAETPGHVDISKAGLGTVPTPPQRKVFKTEQDKQDEEIAFEKRKQSEVIGPEKRAEEAATEERERLRIKGEEERQDARDKTTMERQEATQKALDMRLKNQQGFQLSLERLKELAADNRERMREASQWKLTDTKAGDALEKQAIAERAKNVSETLKTLQAQLTQATTVQKQREAEAEKRGWTSFWKDSVDVTSAAEDIENAKAAITFLTDNKADVISGKKDMDEITGKTEDILRNGQPQWSRGAWSAANPGKDVEKASLAAMKQGLKVVP